MTCRCVYGRGLRASWMVPSENCLTAIDVGLDVGKLIELGRYVVAVAPEHDSIANVIGWTGERHPVIDKDADPE
jgi:hypothetical protein